MSPGPHHRIILLGPPGAGKGTQAELLTKALKLKHIASGDLFRYHLSQGTELGKKANEYMSKGELVPDNVTIKMVLQEIFSPESKQGFMLDGFPRTLVQAKRLDESLWENNLEINTSLLLVVSREELIKRISGRGRPDDNPEAVKKRLEVYAAETEPLIEYYKKQGKLKEVDGVGSIEEVQQKLQRALA